jgi:hypothetical protein
VLSELLQPALLPSDALVKAANAGDTSDSGSGRFVLVTPCTAGHLSSDDTAVAQLLAHKFEVYKHVSLHYYRSY